MISRLGKFDFFWGSILIFTFTIPLSQFLSIRLLIISCLLSLFNARNWELSRILKNSWPVLLYLFVLSLGLIYSSDLKEGLKTLETNSSLFMMSIAFAGMGVLTKEKLYLLFLSFISGLTLASLFCLFRSIYSFSQTGNTKAFFFDDFTQIINYQPAYFAYYLCFSIMMGLYFLYYEKVKFSFFLFVTILLFLFAALMLTGGRTAYISLLFGLSFFILKFLYEDDRTIPKKVAFATTIFFLIAMLMINHYNLNSSSNNKEGDYWERYALWESAIDANPNVIFGVGTGDHKAIMNKYYDSHNLKQFVKENFNAHNQFLQLFFSNGLIGLCTVLILIGWPLYLSVRYQNVLGVLVFFSFVIYGMTEVFLGRYQGVIFFALLNQSFLNFYGSGQSTFSLKGV